MLRRLGIRLLLVAGLALPAAALLSVTPSEATPAKKTPGSETCKFSHATQVRPGLEQPPRGDPVEGPQTLTVTATLSGCTGTPSTTGITGGKGTWTLKSTSPAAPQCSNVFNAIPRPAAHFGTVGTAKIKITWNTGAVTTTSVDFGIYGNRHHVFMSGGPTAGYAPLSNLYVSGDSSFDKVAPGNCTDTNPVTSVRGSGTIDLTNGECLGRGTLIATPGGSVPVEAMQIGMTVYTADAIGRRVAVTVVRVGNRRIPATHRMLTIHLSDRRSVTASPSHPTAGYQPLASLHVGDMLDGAVITSITSQPYQGDRTYDVLPAGSTGTYWADGVLLGSTLRG